MKIRQPLNVTGLSVAQKFLQELQQNLSQVLFPSDRRHGTLAKNHGKSLASLAKILP